MTTHRSILLVVVLAFGFSLFCLGAEVKSWSQCEKELQERVENDGKRLFDQRFLTSFLNEQKPSMSARTDLLYELAIQSTYPGLGIAGMAALQAQNPELALSAAVVRLSQSTNLGSPLLDPYIGALTNRVSPEASMRAISMLASASPRYPGGMSIIIGELPIPSLIAWIVATNRPIGSVSFEALVLEQLLDPDVDLPADQRRRLLARLDVLQDCPGLPRAIHLMRGEVPAASLVPRFRSVLEDEAVDGMFKRFVIERHAKQVKDSIVMTNLAIPPRDQAYFQKLMEKFSK